jgi:LAS superfamily LD-carboxypeptidase LdcB
MDIPVLLSAFVRYVRFSLILLFSFSFLFYFYSYVRDARTEITSLSSRIVLLEASSTTAIKALDERVVSLSDALYKTEERIDDTAASVNRRVKSLSGTVQTLEKLTTTDPELLQKYSKIYFLNENYKPADLTIIPEAFDLKNGKQVAVLSDIEPFLTSLLEKAQKDGVDLQVLSGYRSFSEQTTLKQTYAVRYGQGANAFSADQGYSEHQLGTAVDFTTTSEGENLSAFEKSPAYAWLKDNAYRYGFVLSYPAGNTFYQYEPWHWRFVGKDLARELHRTGKNFYDMEQRDIDTYIPTLFDE